MSPFEFLVDLFHPAARKLSRLRTVADGVNSNALGAIEGIGHDVVVGAVN